MLGGLVMVKGALLAAFLFAMSMPVSGVEGHSIPAGTMLHCRLTQTLSTRLNYQGDAFTATVAEPVLMDGHEVIPAGATLEGRIAWMTRPGRIMGVGQMRLSAERVTFSDGRSFPLSAMLLAAYGAEGARVDGEEGRVKGPTSRLRDLKETGIGMGAGGFVGTLVGGFHGAVVGGAIGGAAAFVDTLRRRGKDLTLPAGTELKYQLTRSLELSR